MTMNRVQKLFDFCVTLRIRNKKQRNIRTRENVDVVGHKLKTKKKKPEIPSTQRGMKSNVFLFMDAMRFLLSIDDRRQNEQPKKSFEDHEKKSKIELNRAEQIILRIVVIQRRLREFEKFDLNDLKLEA